MSSANKVAADLLGLALMQAEKAHGIVVRNGAKLQTQAKANASGRPGPNAPTGDFRRSINRRTTKTVKSSETEVGSSQVQARRLEYGFVGQDSLGRNYNQPAYPSLGPALDTVAPGFIAEMEVLGVPGRAKGL